MESTKVLRRYIIVVVCFTQMWAISQQSIIQVSPDQNQVIFYKDVCLSVNAATTNFRFQLSLDPTFTKIEVNTQTQFNNLCLQTLKLDKQYFWRYKEENQPWRGIFTFTTSRIRIDPFSMLDDVRLLSSVILEKQWIVIDNPTNKTLSVKVFDKQKNLILHQQSDSAFKNIDIQDWPLNEYVFKISAGGSTSETNIYIADVR